MRRIHVDGTLSESELRLIESVLPGVKAEAVPPSDPKRPDADSQDQANEREDRHLHDGVLQKLVHDMKSPLTVMLIELGMLERSFERADPDRFSSGITRLTQNCEELSAMIQNLLDFSRIQSGELPIHPREIRLGVLLAGLVSDPPVVLSKRKIEIFSPEMDNTLEVLADPELTNRALTNVLKILGKLCPQEGRVSVSVHRDESEIGLRVVGEGVSLREDQIRNLFKPYAHQQWRELGLDAGLGIGINFSRRILEAQSGSLRLETVEGEGACFSIHLPLSSAPR